MHGFSIKGINEQKCWIKLIQDLRGLAKVFSILASTESLVQTPLNCFNLFWCFHGKFCIFHT